MKIYKLSVYVEKMLHTIIPILLLGHISVCINTSIKQKVYHSEMPYYQCFCNKLWKW